MAALPTALLAAACAAVLAWLGLTGFAFTDYDVEAAPAVLALLEGDWAGFLSLAPAYGGSLILRAPFALAPTLWGGGELAAFRAGALPGLAAGAVLAVVVVGRMRAAGRARLDRAVVLVAVGASPLALMALDTGHPEELLGAALCAGAVVAAPARPLLAAVLLGLAVANKPWALVAVPAVLVAVPARRRPHVALASAAMAAIVLAPLLAGSGGSYVQTAQAARSTGSIFQPWQLWYLLGGEPGPVASTVWQGVDMRPPPGWLAPVTRPLILAVPWLLAAGVWWRARRTEARAGDALLLLALCLHLRCLLDPWNFSYYALPALVALACWEGLRATTRPPVLTLAYVACVWLSFEWLPGRASPDVLSAAYVAWAAPLTAVLAGRLFWGAHPRYRSPVAGRYIRCQAEVSPGLATQAHIPSP